LIDRNDERLVNKISGLSKELLSANTLINQLTTKLIKGKADFAAGKIPAGIMWGGFYQYRRKRIFRPTLGRNDIGAAWPADYADANN